MSRYIVVAALLVLPLAACDNGAGARQRLAQCELEPAAKGVFRDWNDNYLETCMQAKGYVIAKDQTELAGVRCGDTPSPQEEPECYRPDTDLAAWWAKAQGSPASN